MNIDVSTCIADLLYEHRSVIIPDFGGIVGIYQSAQVDHIQGTMLPPSLALRFNENLVINDGVLISHIRKQYQLNLEDAQFVVRNHVEQLNKKLSRKEILVFPGIGRLYRDFENQLRFLQDSTNYNTDAFGIPEIQFFPILRNRETAPREAPAPTPSSPVVAPSKKAPWLQQLAKQEMVPLAASAMVLVIAMAIFFGPRPNSEKGFKAQPVAERINERPTVESRSAILDLVTGAKEEVVPVKEKVPPKVQEEEIDEEYASEINTEASTLAPQEKVCIVITGAFGQKSSVKKRLNQIVKMGFAPYQDKKGKLTRVGIQFSYESERDVENTVKLLKKKVEKKSWILSK